MGNVAAASAVAASAAGAAVGPVVAVPVHA